ncbi:MAG: M67 family metallopeptidase [Actinomycetota bacterium]
MFRVSRDVYDGMVRLAVDEYPLEACGLVAGPPDADGTAGDDGSAWYPCRNAAESARVYTIDPKDHLRAELDADDHDLAINAVVHSHTHTEAFPSPTDVASAPDPDWHYVIVSLKNETPDVKSYRIVDGEIAPESFEIT